MSTSGSGRRRFTVPQYTDARDGADLRDCWMRGEAAGFPYRDATPRRRRRRGPESRSPAARAAGLPVVVRGGLLEVLRDELGHLEHRDLLLVAEHRQELLVGVDVAAVLLVLEAVLLDVLPDLLRHLGEIGRA